jgi:hypothetical protein
VQEADTEEGRVEAGAGGNGVTKRRRGSGILGKLTRTTTTMQIAGSIVNYSPSKYELEEI